MKYLVAKFTISDKKGLDIRSSEVMQTARDLLASLVAEVGFESFEDSPNGLDGYVQEGLFQQSSLDQVLEDFPIPSLHITYVVEKVKDTDWNATWEEEGFEPIVIDNRCVIHDLIRPVTVSCPLDIVIDARQAFGTGTHETTRMIVSALLDMDLTDKRVLDCGCGTGILSIVAAKCGAREVKGYDIDEWSTRNTEHNAALNEVSQIEVLHGDVHVLSHVSGVFDIVLANINRNILLEDMPKFREVMTHGSILIISGFYQEDSHMLAEKAGTLGMTLRDSISENHWCMMQFVIE